MKNVRFLLCIGFFATMSSVFGMKRPYAAGYEEESRFYQYEPEEETSEELQSLKRQKITMAEGEFIDAAGEGDLDKMEDLYTNQNININAQDEEGDTPLHYAVEMDQPRSVLWLMQKPEILLDVPDRKGQTPLMKAAFSDRPRIVDLLVRARVDVNKQDFNGSTALHIAVDNDNKSIVKELLEMRDINPNILNNDGYTPFMLAALHGNEEIAEAFMLAGIDVNFAPMDEDKDEVYGMTPLFQAIKANNLRIVLGLLFHGADTNARDFGDATPLHYAARKNNPTIISDLLQYKADIDAQDAEGKTPLMYAVELGGFDAVKKLIESGADVDIEDEYGQTALDLAYKPDIVAYLQQVATSD